MPNEVSDAVKIELEGIFSILKSSEEQLKIFNNATRSLNEEIRALRERRDKVLKDKLELVAKGKSALIRLEAIMKENKLKVGYSEEAADAPSENKD